MRLQYIALCGAALLMASSGCCSFRIAGPCKSITHRNNGNNRSITLEDNCWGWLRNALTGRGCDSCGSCSDGSCGAGADDNIPTLRLPGVDPGRFGLSDSGCRQSFGDSFPAGGSTQFASYTPGCSDGSCDGGCGDGSCGGGGQGLIQQAGGFGGAPGGQGGFGCGRFGCGRGGHLCLSCRLGRRGGGAAAGGFAGGGFAGGGFGGAACGHAGCAGGGGCRLAGALQGGQQPYGGAIPHTAGGPAGGQAPQYAYPYYTTRGPRDFLQDGCDPPPINSYNPPKTCLPSIGF